MATACNDVPAADFCDDFDETEIANVSVNPSTLAHLTLMAQMRLIRNHCPQAIAVLLTAHFASTMFYNGCEIRGINYTSDSEVHAGTVCEYPTVDLPTFVALIDKHLHSNPQLHSAVLEVDYLFDKDIIRTADYAIRTPVSASGIPLTSKCMPYSHAK
jgi:hypothetical protein